MLRSLFIDASLIVLLVVGLVDRGLIEKHRKTREVFSVNDFDLLIQTISRIHEVRVTPNTLTEASNLLALHGEPERSKILQELRALIERGEEIVVESRTAARNSMFLRLGLTDAALLEVASDDSPVLTTDASLYFEALSKGNKAAINFNHIRDDG